MGLSLQDQLLKAGIADKKQAKKATQEKRAKRKKKKGKKAVVEQTRAQQTQQARAAHNRELNRRLNQEKEKQAKLAQVRQLIADNRLDQRKLEDSYYFTVGKKIKKVYVDEKITRQLSRGQLGIVTLNGQFEIVPKKVAEQVSARDQASLILLHTPEE